MMEGLSLKSVFIVVVFLLTNLCRGQSQGPHESITAMAGDHVVLPCQLETPSDSSKVTMEWGRPDLEPRFVYVWYEGQERLDDQNVAYKDRVSVSVDKMKLGDISLNITDVKNSDNGRYRCYTPKENKEHFVDLLVGASSPPGVTFAGLDKTRSGVVLQCESAGWYPKPDLSWLDSKGQILSPGSSQTHKGPDGLYTVSSRLTVEERHGNSFTCRVHQKDINQTRETPIQVPGDFFVTSSSCAAFISISVIFGLMLIIAVAFFIWKLKFRPKKNPEIVTKEELELMMDKKKSEEKKAQLSEEASRIDEELKRTDQIIYDLQKIVKELKDQKEQTKIQAQQAEKESDEIERQVKEVDDRVAQADDKTAVKAKEYSALKTILMGVKGKQNDKKQTHQKLEMNIEKLLKVTEDRISTLTENKKNLQTRLEDVKNEKEAMKKNSKK